MSEPLRWWALGLFLFVCGVTALLAGNRFRPDWLVAVDQLAAFVDAGFLLPLWWLNEHDKRWKIAAGILAVPAIVAGLVGLIFNCSG